jgi:hypothetical protein
MTLYARLALQSNRRGLLRSSLLNLLREDEISQAQIQGQAPKEVVEQAYRDSMVEEVEELSKYPRPLFGNCKYTPARARKSNVHDSKVYQ